MRIIHYMLLIFKFFETCSINRLIMNQQL